MPRSEKEMVISCKNIYKEFIILNQGSFWRIILGKKLKNTETFMALKNISLEVPKGKFVGILGRNGAGKSTLLRTLGGVYSPDRGSICVNGEMSSLFELGGFGNSQITGDNYAKRFLQIKGVSKKDIPRLIEDIHEFSELGDSFYNKIKTYSSGMGARLYFSVATALFHDIYLVDEILSVGDEHFQSKCWQRLRERFSKGASGILVTHDWSATLKLCENSHILEGGEIIDSGRTDGIVQRYLALPKPTGKVAKFEFNSKQALMATAGEDVAFHFNIHLHEDTPISFNYSVEMLRVGMGWEILLMNKKNIFITKQKGRYILNLKIPKLPIAPGKYFLNLFLNSHDGSHPSLDFDSCSWTYGNGIELQVLGSKTESVAQLDWRVKNEVLSYA